MVLVLIGTFSPTKQPWKHPHNLRASLTNEVGNSDFQPVRVVVGQIRLTHGKQLTLFATDVAFKQTAKRLELSVEAGRVGLLKSLDPGAHVRMFGQQRIE